MKEKKWVFSAMLYIQLQNILCTGKSVSCHMFTADIKFHKLKNQLKKEPFGKHHEWLVNIR